MRSVNGGGEESVGMVEKSLEMKQIFPLAATMMDGIKTRTTEGHIGMDILNCLSLTYPCLNNCPVCF